MLSFPTINNTAGPSDVVIGILTSSRPSARSPLKFALNGNCLCLDRTMGSHLSFLCH
jgi:hypothetical protein